MKVPWAVLLVINLWIGLPVAEALGAICLLNLGCAWCHRGKIPMCQQAVCNLQQAHEIEICSAKGILRIHAIAGVWPLLWLRKLEHPERSEGASRLVMEQRALLRPHPR
jgi:hypothetical protein